MAMAMTTPRVRRTHSVVRKGRGKGREKRMGRGTGTQLRTGRGKGRGRERETVKENVLFNKPQREMISPLPLLCTCRRK
jgi:hypothetical protein